MNTASSRARRQQNLQTPGLHPLREPKALPPDDPLPPEKLPTPWLADSEWLLEELAKTRESFLRVPLRLDNASDIKSAVDRIWRLEEQLRFLLHLHRDGQRAFSKQLAASQKRPKQVHRPKIVRMRA
jgi:hypothetical protein